MIEVTATTNPYIARWEKRMERPEDWGGMDGLLFAARSHYGSLTLGREFGQSMADFELSGPRIDQAKEDIPMAKFSSKQWQAVAGAFAQQRKSDIELGVDGCRMGHVYDLALNFFVPMFEYDNSQFDREHFLVVVRREQPVNSRPPRS